MNFNTQEIADVRADTPACESVIHFNNAGASLMPTPVHQAVLDHLNLESTIGGYEAHAQAANLVEAFYDEFATLFNASADEIAFMGCLCRPEIGY